MFTINEVLKLGDVVYDRYLNAESALRGCRVPVSHQKLQRLQEAIGDINDDMHKAVLSHLDAIDGQ